MACGGKSSPKSHWLCATLPIVRQWFGNTVNAARAAGDFIDVDDRTLQMDAISRHAKPLRRMSDKPLDNGLDLAPENTLLGAGESRVTQKCGATRKNLFIGRLHVGVGADH